MARPDCGVYTVREAARLLGVSKETIYREIAKNDEIVGVPAVRISGRLVIPAARLNAVLGIKTTAKRKTA